MGAVGPGWRRPPFNRPRSSLLEDALEVEACSLHRALEAVSLPPHCSQLGAASRLSVPCPAFTEEAQGRGVLFAAAWRGSERTHEGHMSALAAQEEVVWGAPAEAAFRALRGFNGLKGRGLRQGASPTTH